MDAEFVSAGVRACALRRDVSAQGWKLELWNTGLRNLRVNIPVPYDQ